MRYLLLLRLVCAAIVIPNKPISIKENPTSRLSENGHSDIVKRGYVTKTCNDEQFDHLKASLIGCHKYAGAARRAIRDNPSLRQKFFKTDDSDDIDKIAIAFSQIEDACEWDVDNMPFRCGKAAEETGCEEAAAYVNANIERVTVCDNFHTYTRDFQIRTLIHELTHLDSILAADDMGAEDLGSTLRLSRADAMRHTDTYAWFASKAYHGDADSQYTSSYSSGYQGGYGRSYSLPQTHGVCPQHGHIVCPQHGTAYHNGYGGGHGTAYHNGYGGGHGIVYHNGNGGGYGGGSGYRSSGFLSYLFGG
ncbi:hypothetical protein PspLS_11269 [Pyricularia sp. CBS 133598]|nr:hypothetical protein PspLS_11269 [Pyricularia sp. CBS 133598]